MKKYLKIIFFILKGKEKIKKRYYLDITLFLLIISLVILIFLFQEKIGELGKLGYLGAFLIAILANATIIIPAPGWMVIVGLGAILNPWIVGIVAGLGATIGQTTGYFLGHSGQSLVNLENSTKYQKVKNWINKKGSLMIFLFALIPNPFVDIVGAAAGVSKFSFLKFLLFCTLGTIPKHIFFALIGYWGLNFL